MASKVALVYSEDDDHLIQSTDVDVICLPKSYRRFSVVLADALSRIIDGKGQRHSATPETPFEEQSIFLISRTFGETFALGQAMKKLMELPNIPNKRNAKYNEVLDVAIYALLAAMAMRKEQ